MHAWSWKDSLSVLFVVVVGALLVVGGSLVSGCSAFESACTKALPAITQGQALVADAQLAVDEARAYCTDLGTRADDCAKAVAGAELALHIAAQSLVLSSQACEARDVSSVFRAFKTAWELVRPFLSLLGGTGGQAVADPIVVGMVR